MLASREPDGRESSTHYSVDLALRYLPDLLRMTTDVSPNDPLNVHLRRWAEHWPLSSVGIEGVEVGAVEVILEHASLQRQYVDRVLERLDRSRMKDLRVREAARRALGPHQWIVPAGLID